MGPDPRALLADLACAFPERPISKETLTVYLRELADIPPVVLDAAIRTVIRTSDHFPRIKAIREAAAENVLGLPSESAALAEVEAKLRWFRESEGDRGDPPPMHPLVKEALDHVGGVHAFRTADEPGVIRGQFLRLFKELRAGTLRDAVVGADALPAGRQPPQLER